MSSTRRGLIESALAFIAIQPASGSAESWLQSEAAGPPHAHGQHSAPPEAAYLDKYQPRFFNQQEFEALSAFCEILIPTDEYPGAKEARCALFIDYVLNAAAEFAPERQTEWRSVMNALRKTGFLNADRRERERIVQEMAAPEVDPHANHPAFFAYRLIKAENAFAFYSSRAGLIETLDYKGDTFNASFPACNHPEHHKV